MAQQMMRRGGEARHEEELSENAKREELKTKHRQTLSDAQDFSFYQRQPLDVKRGEELLGQLKEIISYDRYNHQPDSAPNAEKAERLVRKITKLLKPLTAEQKTEKNNQLAAINLRLEELSQQLQALDQAQAKTLLSKITQGLTYFLAGDQRDVIRAELAKVQKDKEALHDELF